MTNCYSDNITPCSDDVKQALNFEYSASGVIDDSLATPGETTRVEYGGSKVVGVADKKAAPAGSSIKLNPSVAGDSPSSLSFPSLASPGAYVQQWTSNREVLTGTRIFGYRKLKNLLQPQHRYFEDKWGEVKYWTRYLDNENGYDLVYPRIKTYHRENPYRRYQLNKQCSTRTAKKLFKLVFEKHLSGMRVIDMEITMPAAVSEYLSNKGRSGRDMAWNMNKRFWSDMVEYGLIGDGHARRSNLHTWSSEEPLKPHNHFHELIPNYEQVDSSVNIIDYPGCPCPDCGKTLWVQDFKGFYCANCFPVKRVPVLARREWKRNSKYTRVPWNEKELILLKALWLNVQLNFVRQKCIDCAWDNQAKLLRFQRKYGIKGLVRLISFLGRFDKGLTDVYISYVKVSDSIGAAKLVHKLSYNGRDPIEDYAYYSNKYPDCLDPPDFIQGYKNHARVFGWWKEIEKLIDLTEKEEKIKLSPYNAEPMEYLGKFSTSELFGFHDNKLIAVDIIRGSPVERYLDDDDQDWLHKVEYQEYL